MYSLELSSICSVAGLLRFAAVRAVEATALCRMRELKWILFTLRCGEFISTLRTSPIMTGCTQQLADELVGLFRVQQAPCH